MKRLSKNIQADLSFIGLVILLFVYFIFILYQREFLVQNFIIATIVFIIIIITYFTNITTGLIINTTLILAYTTYLIYQSLTKGISIKPYVYFWMFMSPALTSAFSIFSSTTLSFQKQVLDLQKKIVSLSTLNEHTKLKNLRAFEDDADRYLKIAKRYDLDFGIMLIKFKHQRELENLSRKEGMIKIIKQVVDTIKNAVRAEDEIYQLDDEEILFGLLLLTKKEGGRIIHERLKEKIGEIDTNEVLNTKQLVIDMRIGIAYADDNRSILELVDAAKEELQYDV